MSHSFTNMRQRFWFAVALASIYSMANAQEKVGRGTTCPPDFSRFVKSVSWPLGSPSSWVGTVVEGWDGYIRIRFNGHGTSASSSGKEVQTFSFTWKIPGGEAGYQLLGDSVDSGRRSHFKSDFEVCGVPITVHVPRDKYDDSQFFVITLRKQF